MENLEEALAPTLGSWTALVANLDLEDERTEGKAVVAMPQLIKVLEAINEQMNACKIFGLWEEEEGET